MKKLFISFLFLISCVADKEIRDVIVDSEGNKMELVFHNEKEELSINYRGEKYHLKQVPMASGIRYEDGEYQFSQWQGKTEFSKNDQILFRSP